MAISIIKYKPVYQVTFLGKEIGYVQDKQVLEEKIKNEILQPKQENIAFITIEEQPNYELKFINRLEETTEQVVLAKLEEQKEITYKVYSINTDGETKSYVNTLHEAENLVSNIKEEYQKDLELDIGISELYTTDITNLGNI